MRPVAALPAADNEAEAGCGAGFQRAVLGLLRLHIEPMEINYGKTNGKYIELYGNGHNEDGGTPQGKTADRR